MVRSTFGAAGRKVGEISAPSIVPQVFQVPKYNLAKMIFPSFPKMKSSFNNPR